MTAGDLASCRIVGGHRPPLHLSFVCGRAVDGRHRDVIQTQIDAELRAVMNHVVHHKTSKNRGARHRHDRLSAPEQGPVFHQMVVACLRDRRTRFILVLIEQIQHLLSRFRDGGLRRRNARRGDVQGIICLQVCVREICEYSPSPGRIPATACLIFSRLCS